MKIPVTGATRVHNWIYSDTFTVPSTTSRYSCGDRMVMYHPSQDETWSGKFSWRHQRPLLVTIHITWICHGNGFISEHKFYTFYPSGYSRCHTWHMVNDFWHMRQIFDRSWLLVCGLFRGSCGWMMVRSGPCEQVCRVVDFKKVEVKIRSFEFRVGIWWYRLFDQFVHIVCTGYRP